MANSINNLFQFTFTLPNVDAEIIIVTVYGEDSEQACENVRSIDLPLQNEDSKYLKKKISSVFMITDERDETSESN